MLMVITNAKTVDGFVAMNYVLMSVLWIHTLRAQCVYSITIYLYAQWFLMVEYDVEDSTWVQVEGEN